MQNKIKSFLQIFSPVIIGGIIGFALQMSMDYQNLNQPPLAPPAILFPIAWTILYFLIGLSYYFYKQDYPDFDTTTFFYYLQLFFNYLWPILFFAFKLRFLSIFWIITLVILVIFLISQYYQKKKGSAYLLIPYLIWLLFATYLNIGVYILN